MEFRCRCPAWMSEPVQPPSPPEISPPQQPKKEMTPPKGGQAAPKSAGAGGPATVDREIAEPKLGPNDGSNSSKKGGSGSDTFPKGKSGGKSNESSSKKNPNEQQKSFQHGAGDPEKTPFESSTSPSGGGARKAGLGPHSGSGPPDPSDARRTTDQLEGPHNADRSPPRGGGPSFSKTMPGRLMAVGAVALGGMLLYNHLRKRPSGKEDVEDVNHTKK